MAGTYERLRSGEVIYKPASNPDVPVLDLLTMLFESKYCRATESSRLHLDADDPSRHITKAQLRPLVKRVAQLLRAEFGVGSRGHSRDPVLCMSSGHFHLPTLFYGVIAAGGIYSAASPAATAEEAAAQLRLIGGTVFLCSEDVKAVAIAAASLAGLPASSVLAFGKDDGSDLVLTRGDTGRLVALPHRQLEWQRITERAALEESIICILFSSGTTGLPKAVRLSHTNAVATAVFMSNPIRAHFEREAPDFEFRTLAHLPAAHIAGVSSYLINAFYVGCEVYWMPRFDFARFLDHNKTHRITNFFSVPPVFLLIAKSPAVTDHFDHLRFATGGAAPMGSGLQLAAARKMGLGRALIRQTWGLSETTGGFTAMPPDAPQDETGSVSALVPGCFARIVDDAGRDVEPGERGDILVKGPVVTKGYFKNAAATRAAFSDGWFCTGDVGLFRDGLLYIVDRKKELIKYKGQQVTPAELEALLISHPKILDAAVIGVDWKEECTEVPRAYVVADPKQITANEIVDWVAERVAPAKCLRGGVFFLDAVPKSPSGKILRRTLREMAKKAVEESKL